MRAWCRMCQYKLFPAVNNGHWWTQNKNELVLPQFWNVFNFLLWQVTAFQRTKGTGKMQFSRHMIFLWILYILNSVYSFPKCFPHTLSLGPLSNRPKWPLSPFTWTKWIKIGMLGGGRSWQWASLDDEIEAWELQLVYSRGFFIKGQSPQPRQDWV